MRWLCLEIVPEQPTQPTGFRKSGKFEINNIEFRDISVDRSRILATGKKWQHFELSVASIDGMWKEKWRRFGVKLLAIGILLLIFPLSGPVLFGPFLFIGSGYIVLFFFMFLGLLVVLAWLLVKREALRIYTPSGAFKIEGSSGLVDEVWIAIRKEVRWETK
jgi:hypothetical protein